MINFKGCRCLKCDGICWACVDTFNAIITASTKIKSYQSKGYKFLNFTDKEIADNGNWCSCKK